MKAKTLLFISFLLGPSLGLADNLSTPEHDPLALILLWTTLIFSLALLGRFCAKKLHQPGVLGELIIGIALGNICYFFGQPLIIVLREGSSIFNIMREMLSGLSLDAAVHQTIPNLKYSAEVIAALTGSAGIDYIKVAYALDTFSRYGVIFLLFMVGLESSLTELKKTGRESLQVALIGVVAPMVLGFLVAFYLLPEANFNANLFIAATLSATSIGITARVLAELNQLHSRAAKTILGAAMLDDVLGLVILAVVSSMVTTGHADFMVITRVIVSTLLFFIGVITLGPYILKKIINFSSFDDPDEAKLFISFIFVMTLSWLATLVQLSSIIGAYAAGMLISDELFRKPDQLHQGKTIQELLNPFEALFAPLFFMLIGMQVKLETFFNWPVLGIASGLTVAAIIGKLVSGWGASKQVDRLIIGIGMLPRGEVGLVFASIGRTLGIISDQLFSAIILMVIITTLLTPLLLKIRYAKVKPYEL